DRGTSVLGSFAAFRPETATDYELGLKSDWFDRRLRINAAAYYIDYKDVQRRVIVADPVNGSLATLIANAASAEVQGLELEVTAVPVEGLTLTSGVGYTKPKYERFLDRGVDRSSEKWPVPEVQVNLGVQYAWPTSVGEVLARVDGYWQSDVT